MATCFANAAGRMNEAILRSAGKSVTFTHSGGSAEVTAVITTPEDVDEQEAGIYREAGVNLSAMPVTPVKGDLFTVDGVVYRVETLKFPGDGWLDMSIRKVS